MDETTRKEIQRIAARTLQDAGLAEPPLSVERLLEHVNLYRDYYDLSDPGFLDRAKHKLKIHGRRLVEIVNKVRLRAVLLFDENRICIDNDLPRIKRPWASCHETGHRILPWHKPFFYADTAETLDPAYQAALEEEANYAAARLLFHPQVQASRGRCAAQVDLTRRFDRIEPSGSLLPLSASSSSIDAGSPRSLRNTVISMSSEKRLIKPNDFRK